MLVRTLVPRVPIFILAVGLILSVFASAAMAETAFVQFEDSKWFCEVPEDPNQQSTIHKMKQGELKQLKFKKALRTLKRVIQKLTARIKNITSTLKYDSISKGKRKKLKNKRATLRTRRGDRRSERKFVRQCKKGEVPYDAGEDPTPTPEPTPTPDPNAPPPPQMLAGIPGDKQTTLTWQLVSQANSYRIYWLNSPGVTKQNGNLLDDPSTPFVHGGLTNGQTYYYVVTALSDTVGESQVSNEIALTPSGIGPYDPPWGDIEPLNTIDLNYNPALSAVQNGANLKSAVAALQPGDMLRVGDGVYDLGSNNWNLNVLGTASAPISVVAQAGASPVLERNTTSKNIIEMGHSPTRYFRLEGFEMRGGSAGIRMYDTQNVWLNNNEIHSTADSALTTNTENTAYLYITRNTIHDTAGYGEGMYLGANNGAVIMRDSIIALNHVYDTQNTLQGDGIELKQGSYGNWIVQNLVHDTKYPCILVYGTNGQPQNIIEKNILYNSQDNTMQVQGEALVVNNLIMNGAANAFYSGDHQGSTTNLQVIHNTIINTGTAARLSSWSNESNMVFANNVAYSQNSSSMNFSGGSSGVSIAGNVVFGPVQNASSGYINGNGLTDFVNITWGANPGNPYPSPGSAFIGAADPAYGVSDDLLGDPRVTALDAGALDYNN